MKKSRKRPIDKFLDRFTPPPQPMTAEDKDRIYREIRECCEVVADCWIFPTRNSSGYGAKWIDGKMRIVSRWMLAYATRESYDYPLDACHVGDCPAASGAFKYRACCNPLHLWWGSHQENAEHREAEKRKAHWDKRWAKDPPLGYSVKTTEEGVDTTLHGIPSGFSPPVDLLQSNSGNI